MVSTKTKVMVAAGLAIAATIIIITITLWPNQSQKDEGKGEAGTDKQDDNSKFNLINIHSKISNHTRIMTSTVIATAAIILISILIKEYLHNRRIKKRKTTNEQYEMRDLRNQNSDPSREHLAPPHTYQGRA